MSDYRAIRRELDRMEQSLKNMDASAIQRATEEIRRGIERFAEPQKLIAELERHNELLRAVASAANDLRYFVATNQDEQPYNEFIHKLITMAAKLKAAIDAGALETNAYREGYTAGTREDANKPEPYPPYDIGTDQANDWLRGFRDAGALEGE